MNESVIVGLGRAPALRARKRDRFFGRGFAVAVGYSSFTAALIAGWYLREAGLVNPETGLGYWLGISGATLMLLLLLYPFRKRLPFLRTFGPIREWFRLHMLFGLIGPLLILYHCNFQVGSFNSKIALYCMLLVAGSGIFGRYFYARIHRGLYGRKANLTELQTEFEASMDIGRVLGDLTPRLVSRLQLVANEIQGDGVLLKARVSRCLKWSVQRYFLQWSLIRTAQQELKFRAAESEAVAGNYRALRSLAVTHISTYMNSLSRVSQFTFYERLFSLWHVLHLPIFFVMVMAALLHVLAVHMY
jgi:hypothetical protein